MKTTHVEPRGLIFDCDGTLADTMPLHWRAWNMVTQRHGLHFPEDRFYSLGGVPARDILKLLAREQDRLALCELHPEEFLALRGEFGRARGVSVHEMDGYVALRAMLPPPERRALVLVDPPYEAQEEWTRVAAALREGLGRFPSGVYAVWYPLTERAGAAEFFEHLRTLRLPPTLVAELTVEPESTGLKGCGLLIVNPPWGFDREADSVLQALAQLLRRASAAGATLRWLVPE